MFNFCKLFIGFHLSRYFKRPIHLGLPFFVSIEPTTSCNLRCPECPSGLRAFTRPTGMLHNNLFESIIKQIKPSLHSLTFYFQGEPYLNPDFLDMVSFANKNNEPEVPLIIHRAPLGTHERFIGFLLEHYAGKFPTWLAPLQVKILPISDKFMDYANTILQKLKNADIRVEIDDRNEKIGKKIRDTELARVPYMLVIGEKEMNEGKAAVRRQGKGDAGAKDIEEFLQDITAEIKERRAE